MVFRTIKTKVYVLRYKSGSGIRRTVEKSATGLGNRRIWPPIRMIYLSHFYRCFGRGGTEQELSVGNSPLEHIDITVGEDF